MWVLAWSNLDLEARISAHHSGLRAWQADDDRGMRRVSTGQGKANDKKSKQNERY